MKVNDNEEGSFRRDFDFKKTFFHFMHDTFFINPKIFAF